MTVLFPYRGVLPEVPRSAWVAPNAALVGDVALGEHTSVWFSSTLRGDVQPIRIGARCSIQDNGVVHATRGWCPTRVGDDCTIGHSVILHGCVIGDRVLVGMGSVVMDAAELGADVILGAGSLVTPGAKIPPGVLAHGRPARPVRDLRPDERASILEAAAAYVEEAAAYARDLGPGGPARP